MAGNERTAGKRRRWVAAGIQQALQPRHPWQADPAERQTRTVPRNAGKAGRNGRQAGRTAAAATAGKRQNAGTQKRQAPRHPQQASKTAGGRTQQAGYRTWQNLRRQAGRPRRQNVPNGARTNGRYCAR